jgi:hypothetical protein
VMLHVNASRYPARFAVIGALALSALAALALERLPRIGAPARYAAAAAMLAIPAFFAAGGAAATPARGMILAVFVVLAMWMGMLCLAPGLLARREVIVAAALLLAVDLFLASRPLLVHGPFIRKSAPWSALVSGDRKVIRLGDAASAALDPSNAGIWMGGYRNLLERKFDASTPAPVVPLEYLRLHDRALYDARIDLLHRLSVGYLITDRTLDRPELALAGAAGGIRIYSLPGALPLATAWSEGAPAAGAKVTIAAMEANRAVIDVSSPIPVSVVLTQLHARGWRASVDGKKQLSSGEKKIFRAVDVSAGRHRIVWEYDPFFVRIASVISILSVIAVAARELIDRGSSSPKKY